MAPSTVSVVAVHSIFSSCGTVLVVVLVIVYSPLLCPFCKSISPGFLRQWFLKCGPHTSNSSLSGELVRKANYWATSQTYWIRNSGGRALQSGCACMCVCVLLTLRYKSHAIKFTSLKCPIWWFLVYPQRCATSFRTFFAPQKKPIPFGYHPLNISTAKSTRTCAWMELLSHIYSLHNAHHGLLALRNICQHVSTMLGVCFKQ